jgi:hypothetical protein
MRRDGAPGRRRGPLLGMHMKKIRKYWWKVEDRFPDPYHEFMLRIYLCRRERFPWFYQWKFDRVHRKNMMEKFGFVPGIGDKVEDCRGQVHAITELDPEDPDTVTFADGFSCSLWNCCGLP